MPYDPILQEVYATKDKIARQYGGDVHKLFEHFRKNAKKHPERMANLQPPHGTTGHKRASAKS